LRAASADSSAANKRATLPDAHNPAAPLLARRKHVATRSRVGNHSPAAIRLNAFGTIYGTNITADANTGIAHCYQILFLIRSSRRKSM
jgi:hypothetical protein